MSPREATTSNKECDVCWGCGELDINDDMETIKCWKCNQKKKKTNMSPIRNGSGYFL